LKILSLPYPKKTNRKIIINNKSACFEAPEIRNGASYTVSSDIYLIGAIIFYMFSGFNNFEERLEDSLSVYALGEKDYLNKNMMNIIKKCTAAEPEKRVQAIDEIIADINNYFGKDYSIIQKQYVQVMPQYRIKPLARYNLIDKILNNIKEHFFVDRPNKVSLVVSPEGVGKDNFLEILSIKVEQEGFVPVKTILTESDFLRFSVSETIVKNITKYMDKEIMEKYFGDINNAISQISQYRTMPFSTGLNYSGEESKVKFIQRLNNLITEASRKFKFVFIIDNFQWIDEDSLKLINEILKSQCDSRTYLILSTDKETYNKNIRVSEYCSKLKEMSFLDTISLKKFNFDDTAEYIRLILGMDKTPYDFAKIIYDKTKGSTEQVYDTIYMLFSNNSIFVDDSGCWVLDKVNYELMKLSDADDIDTLNNVYSLNSTYQDILKVISVFGIAVSSDVVGNFVEAKGGELISQLNYLNFISILVRKQNDWGISYSFNSIHLKEAVYESIPVEKRRKYHEKASYVLKSKLNHENKENEEELLCQMLKANWHLEVKEYMLSCTKEMIEKNSLSQAIQFLEHAYSLFSKENASDERMMVCNRLGELYERVGEYSKAVFYYNIIENVSKDTKNSYSLIDVYIRKFSLMYKMYDRKTALKYIALSKRLLKTTDYKKGLYEHVISVNRIMLHKRKYNSYLSILENVLKDIDKEQYKNIYVRLLGVCGRFKAIKGRYEEALSQLAESISILNDMKDYRKTLFPLNSMGLIYFNNLNEIQKAKEYFEKSLSISQKVGEVFYLGASYSNLAEIYRTEDKNFEAIRLYQSALDNINVVKDKHTEFLVCLNLVLSNIEIEDYKKALMLQNEIEEEFMRSKHSRDLLDLFYQCRAEFFYAIGEYEKAHECAQKSVDMCITWGIPENYEAHFVKLLSEIQQKGSLDHERDSGFLDKVFGENLYKLGRIACVKLAEIYVSNGMQEQGKEFLERGLSYVSNIDTEMLRLRYEYVGALVKTGTERLESLIRLAGIIETEENNEMNWKIYKAIAIELVEQKNYREALKHLITSLNYLRKLVYNVPDEYKVKFINSHDRGSVKESLSQVAALMTLEGDGKANIIEKRYINKQGRSISLQEIDKYFDYTEYRKLYRKKETDEIAISRDADTSMQLKFLGKLQELMSRFNDDETINIKHTIDLLAEITQAKNAFIATLQEDGSLNVIASYNRYLEAPFYKYVIEQVKQKKDSIIVNDTFEYNAKKGDILIPKDITAVFCIPVMIPKERDSIEIELGGERRRYQGQDNNTIIGYIYLDTDSIINNFTQESSRFCIMAAKIAYVLTDNYNMKIVSTVDKLTKLYTRKYFELALSNELMYVEEEGEKFSIIMADIDKFKNVNDRFGHQKGDEVLQNICSIIMSSVRKGDICGRYGGEEIIILLPGTDSEGAYSVAEKIRKKVENSKLLGLNIPLTISLGISSYPEHGNWAKDLIDKADQAMHHVKESGRNGSRIYEPNMSNSIKRIDRLAGIISGDIVEDQRKVETMLEILELQRDSHEKLEENMFKFLGRIIEVSEAQTGGIFYIEETDEGEMRISKKLLRKRLVDRAIDEAYYNENILQKCMDDMEGEYQIDWNGYSGIDPLTGMPDWQSVIAVPMIDRGKIKGIAYLSVSIKNKEFDADTYNYVKTLSDIMAAAF
jgi:diguanylate cyclase (GGDEF)-like protein